jgi:8-oxo-dGTP pyrophosphatase MutT (NUDIX family)
MDRKGQAAPQSIDWLSEEEIKRKLAFPTLDIHPKDDRYRSFFREKSTPAAVLIPITRFQDNTWHILFTRRTNQVADHKGQVSFPGGRKNPEDLSPQSTALREAFEEIGLRPSDVQIVGTLDGLHTISNYLVIPVVGIIPWPYPFKLETKEVERVFTLPLAWLANSENFRYQTREVKFTPLSQPQTLEVVYYEPWDGEILWGVSAEITIRLLERLNVIPKR